jgi:hypothetical protein
MLGFELRTFQCVGCGDVEKRPVFDSSRAPRGPRPRSHRGAGTVPAQGRDKVGVRYFGGQRGNAVKPSRFGIFTFGSDCASSTSSCPITPLR